jgi:pyrimidine-nucleoside phosphorylase
MTDTIAAKRDGHELSEGQIRHFISGYTDGSVPDYQAAALIMAVYLRGLTDGELAIWADAMLRSGIVLDLSSLPGFKVDKHSTGGVGDKVSLILAPLVAEAGVTVPMIAGRGLGHTGGTLDKLEAISGFTTALPVESFVSQLAELGCCIIGQTPEIAPADRKIYALRDTISTIDCIPLIASSIMSKKLAEGIDGLVLDIKVGTGAFMRTVEQARELAKTMVAIGEAAGKQVVVLLTDMDQPLGSHIGNALEVVETVDVLAGKPGRLRDVTVELGAYMVQMARGTPLDDARKLLAELLDNGKALARFRQMVAAQGGDLAMIDDLSLLPTAARTHDVSANVDGYFHVNDCTGVGEASRLLGAGRARKEDVVDPAAGIVMYVEAGASVKAGDLLATLHFSDAVDPASALALLNNSCGVVEQRLEPQRLIVEVIGG